MDVTSFNLAIAAFGVKASLSQHLLLQKLCGLLLEENSKSNLTAISSEEDVWQKHFVDSLSCAAAVSLSNSNIIDVGSGAGFPALPLAVLFPQSLFTCLEATNKKVHFIELAAGELGLCNVLTFAGRAEEAAQLPKMRQSYDIVLSRAVAQSAILAELCLPLCKTGGYWISQKACKASTEIREAEKSVEIMGGFLKQTIEVTVAEEKRLLLVYEKVRKTPPAYPRRNGVPAKSPLK